jgi:hypothetical protein
MADMGIKWLDAIAPRRGDAVLLEVLRSEGCRHIFGNPGTAEPALMDALFEALDIGYIWGLQEASVVAMADGYAHASGRHVLVNLHRGGPGARQGRHYQCPGVEHAACDHGRSAGYAPQPDRSAALWRPRQDCPRRPPRSQEQDSLR